MEVKVAMDLTEGEKANKPDEREQLKKTKAPHAHGNTMTMHF